jgi:hypothetical protein
MMTAAAARRKPKQWRNIETIAAMDNFGQCYRHGDEKVAAYAAKIGATLHQRKQAK